MTLKTSSDSISRDGKPTQLHYNEWPNSQGFDCSYEERTPVELKVEGNIPSYAAGVLFRTGLGPRTVETDAHGPFRVHHWFDNFAQVHRFQIHPPQSGNSVRITYSSRIVSDGVIEKVKKTGMLSSYTFASKHDPCMSFFQKMQATFISVVKASAPAPNEVNVGVTMSANFPGLTKTGEPAQGGCEKGELVTLCNKTDAQPIQMLDPETLEPIGVANQTVLHADLKGAGSGAHAKSDSTGDVYNYNLDFGRTGTYRLFRVSASTGKTSILATVSHTPAYLHSLFLTENYVILCVWNSFYTKGGASIFWNRNLLDSMYYDGNCPTTWFVVDRRAPEDGGQGLVATYESDPFYCFHTINAYEERSATGSIDIVADLTAYQNLDVIHRFYLENLMSDSPAAKKWSDPSNDKVRPTYRRYRLANIPAVPPKKPLKTLCEYESKTTEGPELPTISPAVATKRHRYIYGINDSGKSSFADSLVKYDTETKSATRWSVQGHTAGEPIFVPDPDSPEEDGGVLLSVVLDGHQGKSYLLVLDAQNLQELGRAHVDGVVGFGFHGLYANASEGARGQNALHV